MKKSRNSIKVMDENGKWSTQSKNTLAMLGGNILPKSTYMEVGKKMAENILKNNNIRNRKLSNSKVNIYSNDLLEGKWAVTHQGIAFYEDGVLADGQHRLEAIARTGVPVVLLVVFGLSYESAIFIDEGKKRSVSDVSDISPFHDTVTKEMQSVSAVVISSLKGSVKKGTGLRVLNSTRSRLEFCEKHREALIESCRIENQPRFKSAVRVFRSVLFRLYYNLETYNFSRERYNELIDTINACIIRKEPQNNIERLWKKVSEYKNRTGYAFYSQCHLWAEKCFYNFMINKDMNRISEEKNEIFPIPEEKTLAESVN